MKTDKKTNNYNVSRLAAFLLILTFTTFAACSGGNGGGNPPTGTISGSVSGTTVIAVNGNGDIVASDDTAGKLPDANGNFSFALREIPVGTSVKVFLITGGGVYPMYFDSDGNGTSDTNVFSLGGAVDINLGFVNTAVVGQVGRAIPQNSPTGVSGVSAGAESTLIPASILNPPDASSLTIDAALEKGISALKSGWILGGKTYLKRAVEMAGDTQSQAADAARFFYAAARIAALGFETTSDGNPDDLNRLGDLLDKWGCDPADHIRVNPDALDASCFEPLDRLNRLPDDSPRGKEYQDFLYNAVGGALNEAIANLNQVSSAFNRSESVDGVPVEFDHADKLAIRAGVKGLLAFLAIQKAYDLDADIDIAANDPALTVEKLLAGNPNLLKLADVTKLDEAKKLLTSSALDDLMAAIDAVQAETDAQADDLIKLTDVTSAEITQAKADLKKAKDCVNGIPCSVDDNNTPLDASDDTMIDLDPFFLGVSIREILPGFAGNVATGFWPDTTFGGILTQVIGFSPRVLNDDLDRDGTADSLEGDRIEQITFFPRNGRHPHWHPNGSTFSFHGESTDFSTIPATTNTDIWTSQAIDVFFFPNRRTSDPARDRRGHWHPDGSKIVFQTDRTDGTEDIWVMDAEGLNQAALTSGPANDRRPHWSPDGLKILFDSDRSGNDDIWVMDANGSNNKNLTNHAGRDRHPHWSPDGTKVIFQSDRRGTMDIWVMNADGSSPAALTSGSANETHPDWIGNKVVFRSDQGLRQDIWVMGDDGSNPMRLTDDIADDKNPHWRPDGTGILFSSDRSPFNLSGEHDIFCLLCNLDGGTAAVSGGGGVPAGSPSPF